MIGRTIYVCKAIRDVNNLITGYDVRHITDDMEKPVGDFHILFGENEWIHKKAEKNVTTGEWEIVEDIPKRDAAAVDKLAYDGKVSLLKAIAPDIAAIRAAVGVPDIRDKIADALEALVKVVTKDL